MNIILTVNYSPWSSYSGGGQNSTHNIATALSSRGNDVTVVYTKPPWEKVMIPEGINYSIRWAFFFGFRSTVSAIFRPLNAISVRFMVNKILKEKYIDVVHSQGEEGALIPGLKKRYNFRFVVTPRYPAFPEFMFREQTLIEKILLYTTKAKYTTLRYALRGADICCPTSDSSRSHIMQVYKISGEKIKVIPNGINESFFEVTRNKDAHKGPIIFFGRLTVNKGIDILLKALAQLGNESPRVLLIGRGDDKTDVNALIEKYNLSDTVELVGWQPVEVLQESLATASMAVLPSREESFGNAMIETIAMGVPLITTRVGSIPENIDNRMAVLAEINDVDAIANGIKWISCHYREAEKRAERARDIIKKKFSWDETTASFEKVYYNENTENKR